MESPSHQPVQQYLADTGNQSMYTNTPNQLAGNHATSAPLNIPTPKHYYPQATNQSSYPSNNGVSPRTSNIDPESKYSGGSQSSYQGQRPPSAQSSGYRLATDIDMEGYLAPRSSAGSSYQYPQGGEKPISREHDSGVDIDRSGHHDSRSNSSDLSSKSSVQFHPNGAMGWSSRDKLALDMHPSKDMTKSGRPESLAYRSHEYEELPLKKDQYVYADVDENVKSNTSLPAKHEPSGSQDNLTGSQSNYRRRQNPLYDAVIREDSKASGKTSSAGCNRCVCVSIVIVALLSGLGLTLALVAMSGAATWAEDSARTVYMVSTPSYAQLQEAMDRITDLEARYSNLLNKYQSLQAAVGLTNDTDFDSSLLEKLEIQTKYLDTLNQSLVTTSTQVSDVQAEVMRDRNDSKQHLKNLQNEISGVGLQLSVQNVTLVEVLNENIIQNGKLASLESSDIGVFIKNLTSQNQQLTELTGTVHQIEGTFSNFRTEIRASVDTISKQPGPTGPPGSGNLTQCEHTLISNGVINAPNPFYTTWVPNYADNQRFVIMGLDCSTNMATSSFLQEQSSQGFKQYRCACSGTQDITSSNNRFCDMHVWRCPRIS